MAQYVVEHEMFGTRARRARCSNCGHQWQAQPTLDGPGALPAPLAEDPSSAFAPDGDAWRDDDVSLTERRDESGFDDDPRFPPLPTLSVEAESPLAVRDSEDAAPLRAAPDEARVAQSPAPASGEAVGEPAEDAEDLELAFGSESGASDAAPPEPASEPTPMDTPVTEVAEAFAAARASAQASAESAKRRKRKRLTIVAAAVAAAFLLGVGSLIALHEPITRAIPGMGALYHLVGLTPAPPGANLDIGEVTSRREWEEGDDILIVTGMITNTANEPRTLPPLRVTLFDAADTQVQETIIEPDKSVLAPHEHLSFTARIANPSATARRMVVSFDTSAAGPS